MLMSPHPFTADHGNVAEWSVLDLFSCGGGTSAGFSPRRMFKIIGAVDFELAKPSGGSGSSDCNATYERNHGVAPLNVDLMDLAPAELADRTGIRPGQLDVLISCAPCTDLSRAKPGNHSVDSARNSLVTKSGAFAAHLLPDVFIMENARELVRGNFKHHHEALCAQLRSVGYDVSSEVHMLSRFGLPQIRERAIVIASRLGKARNLSDLWRGWSVRAEALTVRSALNRLEQWRERQIEDKDGDAVPGMGSVVSERLRATPSDGGGWLHLAESDELRPLLPDVCIRRWNENRRGDHPDVYGRMWWDRPAPTIKRECAHVGNGRYAHPEADRLLSVREMATVQGFPFTYRFPSVSVANRYRHIGDAVPPLIAWQIAALVIWMKTGERPTVDQLVMPDTCLSVGDLVAD